MIEKYDITIDTDGDGSTIDGVVELFGSSHRLEIVGGGRDLDIRIDGEAVSEGIAEDLGEWLDPYDAIQEVLTEISGEENKYDIEDYSGRVVNGKVVRLIVRDGRELRVVRGTLVDDEV